MRILLTCLASSVVGALTITLLAGIENGFTIGSLGLMLIAFLYLLAVALVIGLPFHFLVTKRRFDKLAYYAIFGTLVGIGFMVIPLVRSDGSDPSLWKAVGGLATAGFLTGSTFHQVLRRLQSDRSNK